MTRNTSNSRPRNQPSDPLRLPANLGIEHAQDLKSALLDRLDDEHCVDVEAQDVSRLHAASVQLLCALFRDRAQAGRETRLLTPSTVLADALALSGAQAVFFPDAGA